MFAIFSSFTSFTTAGNNPEIAFQSLPKKLLIREIRHTALQQMRNELTIYELFVKMLSEMGPQGWWPADSRTEIIVGAARVPTACMISLFLFVL
jgi:hypothetical protein